MFTKICYSIGAILRKLSTILRILSFKSTYRRLNGGGGCPRKACNLNTLVIDSLHLRTSEKLEIVGWHSDTLPWTATAYVTLFVRGSSCCVR